jgi:23S rRNA (pseudouridine1915-N3)-methyltransferase
MRFDRTGRGLGLGPARVVEVEDKKGGGMVAEAALLTRAIPDGALICILDERGKVEKSPDFSARLGGWRDAGRSDLAFVIGGADGIDAALRQSADHTLSFGKMVWPHMLVRVMLSEQLYRAASILSGGPYHRT